MIDAYLNQLDPFVLNKWKPPLSNANKKLMAIILASKANP